MSLISYFGGKSSKEFHNFINKQIPKDGIKKYLEPFSGSFATYMDDPDMNFSEIYYNDFNNHQMNLYKCAAQPEKLLGAIENVKNTLLKTDLTNPLDKWDFYKSHYKDLVASDFLDFTDFTVPDFEKAAIYAFLITSSHNSVYPRGGGFNGYKKPQDKLKLEVLISKLKKNKYTDKLQAITDFTSTDFEEFIRKHDAEDTYIYLDPPYFRPDVNGDDDGRRLFWYGADKAGVFGPESHRRLLNLLKETKSRWSLSYYYFPLLEELLPRDKYRWLEKEVNRPSAGGGNNADLKGAATKGVELLIMNYDEDGNRL
jgi:site-specific DNA-adenine methylase